MVYLGIKNIAMLQSMKQLGGPKKKGPKKPSLTYEAKTAQDKDRIDMLARAEARKKRMETPLQGYKLKPVEDDDTPESVSRNLAYEREREAEISERERDDYGRNTPKGQTPYYNRQEMMDQINKPSIKKTIESLRARRAKFEEDFKAKTKPKSK
jgi:hypothetical protein